MTGQPEYGRNQTLKDLYIGEIHTMTPRETIIWSTIEAVIRHDLDPLDALRQLKDPTP